MTETHKLNLKCSLMMDEFRSRVPVLEKIKDVAIAEVKKCLSSNNIIVSVVEARVKAEDSLAGKLELKGNKYSSLDDITDLVGLRVIAYYTDEVDKIAALVENIFDVDWDNSVDKRKSLGKDSFGYMSLHYICRIPKSLFYDPSMPLLNDIRFEIQMRTVLQHVWANMNHDTGYKSGVKIPEQYERRILRLAGLLEIADDEFSHLRMEVTDYRRKVEQLVKSGNFDEVDLNFDTFKSYLEVDPFSQLNDKIASINQAEIQPVSGLYLLNVLSILGFKTLGDVERLKEDYEDGAYQLALRQISGTDLDIISSTLGLQNLCYVYAVDNGFGIKAVERIVEEINGVNAYNASTAKRIYDAVSELQFIKTGNNRKNGK